MLPFWERWRHRGRGCRATIVIGDYVPEPTVTKRVHREFCKAHLVVPIRTSGAALVVAMADPHDEATIDRLAELTGTDVRAKHRT